MSKQPEIKPLAEEVPAGVKPKDVLAPSWDGQTENKFNFLAKDPETKEEPKVSLDKIKNTQDVQKMRDRLESNKDLAEKNTEVATVNRLRQCAGKLVVNGDNNNINYTEIHNYFGARGQGGQGGRGGKESVSGNNWTEMLKTAKPMDVAYSAAALGALAYGIYKLIMGKGSEKLVGLGALGVAALMGYKMDMTKDFFGSKGSKEKGKVKEVAEQKFQEEIKKIRENDDKDAKQVRKDLDTITPGLADEVQKIQIKKNPDASKGQKSLEEMFGEKKVGFVEFGSEQLKELGVKAELADKIKPNTEQSKKLYGILANLRLKGVRSGNETVGDLVIQNGEVKNEKTGNAEVVAGGAKTQEASGVSVKEGDSSVKVSSVDDESKNPEIEKKKETPQNIPTEQKTENQMGQKEAEAELSGMNKMKEISLSTIEDMYTGLSTEIANNLKITRASADKPNAKDSLEDALFGADGQQKIMHSVEEFTEQLSQTGLSKEFLDKIKADPRNVSNKFMPLHVELIRLIRIEKGILFSAENQKRSSADSALPYDNFRTSSGPQRRIPII